MKSFDIGLSALRAQQQTLSVLGNNLANAATPGYHRQRAELATRAPQREYQHFFGNGVDVNQVARLRDSAVETAMIRNSSETATSQQTLAVARQLESLLTPGDSTIHASLSNFFNRLEKSSNAPQDLTVRQEFLSSAEELMNAFNTLDEKLVTLARDVRLTVDDGVKAANLLMSDISQLNANIFQARCSGSEPNDLLDRRDQILPELSQWIDAESVTLSSGREQVLVAGGAVAIGSEPVTLGARDYQNRSTGITAEGTLAPLALSSGRLLAMTTALNQTIPAFRERLSELAQQIVRTADQQHAQGMTDQGPYSVLLGTRGLLDVTTPLGNSSPTFPISSGKLSITITEDATGIRRTETISINTATESLTDVAAKLTALTGVAASIDSVRRTMMISAEGPYSIDFAGRPDNVPVLTGMAGTSLPEFSGRYTGDSRQEWNVTFSGSGTIGETVGLTAIVRNAAGQVLAIQDVGAGYGAGAPQEIMDGVSLRFGSGTVTATDTFSLTVTNNPDETGILSALGINALFSGSEPGRLKVRDEVRRNPELLATSRSGLPGDAQNLAAIAKLRDLRVTGLNGRTFIEELADVTAESGLVVQAADSQVTQLQSYQARLREDRDSISGVDINQEMLEMMESQRSYQAAARFLSVADQMLEELFLLAR